MGDDATQNKIVYYKCTSIYSSSFLSMGKTSGGPVKYTMSSEWKDQQSKLAGRKVIDYGLLIEFEE